MISFSVDTQGFASKFRHSDLKDTLYPAQGVQDWATIRGNCLAEAEKAAVGGVPELPLLHKGPLTPQNKEFYRIYS